jgi:hypothetical protein
MTTPVNILQQVQTYQEGQLAYLGNFGAFIHNSNKKFREFEKDTGNLGDTVTFSLPYRFVAQQGLVVNYQPTQQRVQTLTCGNGWNTSFSYTNQQMLFNMDNDDFMMVVGRGAVMELGTEVEADVATLAETQPYRFYGDGVTPINSYTQLATMLAEYRTYGTAKGAEDVYITDISEPQIVGSGLNQFVVDRNEKAANSWLVGDWQRARFLESNLLPVHTSGNTGVLAQTLTVVSTNDPTGNNITQITVSGATASDASAVFKYDSFQFADNVAGQPAQMRYLTFVGHKPCAAPVQIQATADAAADGSGHVVINITPALCATVGNANQNISYNIVAGMKLLTYPSHRCGLIVGGDALYLAMPRLPDQPPFYSSNKSDPDTGTTIRLTYGAVLGQNQLCYVNDVIWGKTAVPEYLMKIMFPLV